MPVSVDDPPVPVMVSVRVELMFKRSPASIVTRPTVACWFKLTTAKPGEPASIWTWIEELLGTAPSSQLFGLFQSPVWEIQSPGVLTETMTGSPAEKVPISGTPETPSANHNAPVGPGRGMKLRDVLPPA